ncbi:hypothetical protein HELRODRAFT_188224 [Helobdella robusta]|uniref:Uncharacterized protein n=1 Tax=Helobdella robusta TaxID=6412 RepID=T1FPS5_HELRO|nr:hypothetical protein HELRODRAFT_188224 [Helobdella robusta]ESO05907.1 hypothetical protein HELRODRAFT_188224 [Helobdella robusta]
MIFLFAIMSTAKREDFGTPTGGFDYLEETKSVAFIVFGAILILFGGLSAALGIGAVCTLASGYYIGYGIWCGILICIAGVFCVFTGYKKNAFIIVTTCVSCTMTCFIAIVQIGIAITAADNDSVGVRQNLQTIRLQDGYLDYDIYYQRNNPYKYLCSGPNTPFTWKTAWGPVDVLLILSGFAVLGISMAAAIMSCIAANKGIRIIKTLNLLTVDCDQFAFEHGHHNSIARHFNHYYTIMPTVRAPNRVSNVQPNVFDELVFIYPDFKS